jgi:hypothetical protein
MRGARVGGILALLLSAFAISGCGIALGTRSESAAIAEGAGLRQATYQAGPFELLAFERFDRPGGDLTVYIESDGLSYLGRNTLSRDPTPAKPLVLQMTALDGTRNRLYLARPCQFLTYEKLRGCDSAYWSFARFAPEVIDAYGAALEAAKRKSGARRLTLVGYSGGGAIAALVAARRDDVALLVTVAGTLDHRVWTERAGVAPLDESLNPADSGARLRAVRQVHFVGGRDTVVPPYVAQSYMTHLGDTRRAAVVTVPDADHECCWVRSWQALLDQYVHNAAVQP